MITPVNCLARANRLPVSKFLRLNTNRRREELNLMRLGPISLIWKLRFRRQLEKVINLFIKNLKHRNVHVKMRISWLIVRIPRRVHGEMIVPTTYVVRTPLLLSRVINRIKISVLRLRMQEELAISQLANYPNTPDIGIHTSPLLNSWPKGAASGQRPGTYSYDSNLN